VNNETFAPPRGMRGNFARTVREIHSPGLTAKGTGPEQLATLELVMSFSESFFAAKFGITRRDLEAHLAEALGRGGDYADLYFEYLATSSISIDESIV
jgi:hypothetical protein